MRAAFFILLGLFVWPCVFLLVWAAVVSSPAAAHDWYDNACCNATDCRPISGVKPDGTAWSEVEQTAEGWVWTSSRTGRVWRFAEGGEPRNDGQPKVRPSWDGHHHGCERDVAGYEPLGLCLYVPRFF